MLPIPIVGIKFFNNLTENTRFLNNKQKFIEFKTKQKSIATENLNKIKSIVIMKYK